MATPEGISVFVFPDNPAPKDRVRFAESVPVEELERKFGEAIGAYDLTGELSGVSVPLREYEHPERGIVFPLALELVQALVAAARLNGDIGDPDRAAFLMQKAADMAAQSGLSPLTKYPRFRYPQNPTANQP